MLLLVEHWSRLVVTGIVLGLVACTGQSTSVAAAGEPAAPSGAFTARVERVVDGDTFIAVRRGQRLRVRLIGVDAPESVKPNWPVECWGPEASRVLTRLLPVGTEVRAAYQPGGHLDRYGRELWDVWLPGGAFLQAVLVRRGAADAIAYRPQVKHAERLAHLDALATAAGRGLHGHCPGL
jgi:micrococcal nuclease